MKGNPVLYKSLVVGVIVLFIGVGIQPAFAIKNQQSTTETDIPMCSNNNLEIINITVWEAWELLTDMSNGNQTPIDIRTDEEWNEGFIDTPYPENPIHYSKAMLETPEGLEEFIETYEDKEIMLYNNQNMGYTWSLYLYILMDAGYSGIIYVWGGGLETWIDEGFPIRNNTSPEPPQILGPARGKKGVNITFEFVADDSERDYVNYSIDWGDNTTYETGLYPSNNIVTGFHMWYENGGYVIRCRATDTYGAESDWAEYLFWVGRSRTAYISLIQVLIERFPLLEVFLRILNL